MKARVVRRVVIAVALLAVGAAGVAIQAQRSASSMQTAANKFLASLTPEQRQRATFPFEAPERMRWHFIPTENFPRNGLLIKDMTEAQRTAAYDVLKSGLSARGYQTYTAIIQLESVLREIEQGAAGRRPGCARSRDLPVLDLRHARRQRHLGLAGRGPPRVAALHGDRRQGRGQHAVVQRHQSRRGHGRPAERHAHPRPDRGLRPGAGDRRSTRRSGPRSCYRPRRRTTS